MSGIRRRLSYAAATMIAITATTVGLQSPASANLRIWHGNDTAYTSSGDTILNTCDYELDGHRVRAHFANGWGQIIAYGSWAPSQGCVQNAIIPDDFSIRLCEEEVGCTVWYVL